MLRWTRQSEMDGFMLLAMIGMALVSQPESIVVVLKETDGLAPEAKNALIGAVSDGIEDDGARRVVLDQFSGSIEDVRRRTGASSVVEVSMIAGARIVRITLVRHAQDKNVHRLQLEVSNDEKIWVPAARRAAKALFAELPTIADPPPPDPQLVPREKDRTVAWVTLGGGVAVAGVATALRVIAESHANDANDFALQGDRNAATDAVSNSRELRHRFERRVRCGGCGCRRSVGVSSDGVMRWALLISLLLGCEPPILLFDETIDAGPPPAPEPRECATFAFAQVDPLNGSASALFVDRGMFMMIDRGGRLADIAVNPELDVRIPSGRRLDLDIEVFDAVLDHRKQHLFLVGRDAQNQGWFVDYNLTTSSSMAMATDTDVIGRIDHLDGKTVGVGHADHGGEMFVDGVEVAQPGGSSADVPPSVAIAADGWAYFVSPFAGSLLFASKPGERTPEPLDFAVEDGITALRRLDDGTVVGGTGDGQLFFLDGPEASFIRSGFEDVFTGRACAMHLPSWRAIQAIESYGDGFVFMNCLQIGQWIRGRGLCEPTRYSGGSQNYSVQRLVRLGDRHLLTAGLGPPIYVVEPTP